MKAILAATLVAFALPIAAPPALASPAGHCPPGLAKKNPPCVPPGQAKKWHVGDRYDGDYDPIRDWWRYRLPRPGDRENWIRVGDVMIRLNEDTMRVIELIALADLVLGG